MPPSSHPSPIPTPPPTTLSDAESPTTSAPPSFPFSPFSSDISDPRDALPSVTMKHPIYLIVATAINPPMGIGLKGALPWAGSSGGGLKTDMAFFRRVTSGSKPIKGADAPRRRRDMNAVIMGRKTWASIPPRFRPLRGRVNVVVTRSVEKVQKEIWREGRERGEKKGQQQQQQRGPVFGGGEDEKEEMEFEQYKTKLEKGSDPILVAGSLGEALERLHSWRTVGESVPEADEGAAEPTTTTSKPPIQGKDFIIGGSEIYAQAIRLASPTPTPTSRPPSPSIQPGSLGRFSSTNLNPETGFRILQTQVRRKSGKGFECDAFFPLSLSEDGEEGNEQGDGKNAGRGGERGGWRRADSSEVGDWVGETLLGPGGEREQEDGMENGWIEDSGGECEIRLVGWERRVVI